MACGPTFAGVAVWNPGLFLGRYPEFTTSYNNNPAQYEGMFGEAGFYLEQLPHEPGSERPETALAAQYARGSHCVLGRCFER